MEIQRLYDIAKENDIEVDCFNLDGSESLSLTDEDFNCYIAIDLDALNSTRDEKRKLAHELGHCMTGAFYNKYSKFDLRAKHEFTAEKWAIKKLIPKDELKNAVEHGFEEYWQLADFFDVPNDFIYKAIEFYKSN